MTVLGSTISRNFRVVLGLAAFSIGIASAAAQAPAPYLLPSTINTIAGGGTAPAAGDPCPGGVGVTTTALDVKGDGCLASSSSVVLDNDVHDVGVDAQGNVYFIDNGTNGTIRRIDARSGVINIFVGSFNNSKVCAGTVDKYGDGCLANDGAANLNTKNAFTASLQKSRGMAVLPNGDVYLADYGGNLAHKISAATGIMTVVAGDLAGGTPTTVTSNVGQRGYTGDGGSALVAELDQDRGVTADAAGNIYIADTTNNVVRKVTAATGFMSTVVGVYPGSSTPATAGYTGDGGPATQAQLTGPEDVEVDANGNLFIADFGNSVIRVVYAGGTQVAALIAATNGGAVAQPGNIYTIIGGGTATYTANDVVLATSVAMGSPRKIALDSHGNIFVADNGNNVIWFVDATTGYMRPVAGTFGSTTGGTGCSAQTNTLGDNCQATLATLSPNSAMGVGADSHGNIYISDSGNSRIREVYTNQSFPLTTAGSAFAQNLIVHFGVGDTPASGSPFVITGSTDFTVPGTPTCTTNPDNTTDCTVAVNFAPTKPGNETAMLVVHTALGATASLALNGTASAASVALDPGTTALFGSGFSAPTGIAQDGAGNTYIADTGNNRVVRYDTAGNPTVIAGTGSAGYSGDGSAASGAALSGPKAVAVPQDGAVYIADTGNNAVRRIDPLTGTISTVAGGASTVCAAAADAFGDGCPGVSSKLSAPSGLAVDANGNVYIADTGNSLIRVLTPSGYIFLTGGGAATVCGPDVLGNGCPATQAIFKSPTALQTDTAGNLYVADTGNNQVRKIAAAALYTIETGTASAPLPLIVSTAGVVTAVAGTGQAGSAGNGGPAVSAQVNGPTGLALDAAGDIYIADTGNHVIRMVNASGAINTTVGTLGASGTGTLPGSAATALLNLPGGIAATNTGALYVLDTGNNRAFTIDRGSIAYNFGTTAPNTSSPTVIIQETSTGSATANLNSPLFASTGDTSLFSLAASGSNGCAAPQTLTAGSSCYLAAQFAPTALGPANATYTQSATNTVNSPAPTIQLSGVGAILTATSTAAAVTNPATGNPQYSVPFTVTAIVTPVQCNTFAPSCFPTGTVTFSVDGTNVGLPATVGSDGMASANITGLSVGSHSVVAIYNGDNNYASSTAPALAVSIAQGPTSVSLTATPSTVVQFNPLKLTAQVKATTSDIPTGSVSFYAGTTLLGIAGVNPTTGLAVLADPASAPTTLGLFAGTYSLTAVYSGDNNYDKSTSTAISLTVTPEAPNFSLSFTQITSTTPNPTLSTSTGTAQGSTALAYIYVTPSNTLNGAVSFACSGMPANSTCTVTPTTLTFTPVPGAPIVQTAQLTLWTDVAPGVIPSGTTSRNAPPSLFSGHSATVLASLLGWPLLLFSFAGIIGFRKRLQKTRLLAVIAIFGILAGSSIVLSGCSNSSGSTKPNLTPVGSYNVTVTVSGPNSTSQTLAVQFTVAPGVAGQL